MNSALASFFLLLAFSTAEAADCTANVQPDSKTQIADLKAAIRCLAQENVRLRETLPQPAVSAVPSGSVVAFRAVSCPQGWSPYQRASGRVIVGTGSVPGKDFLFEESGGQVSLRLTVANLPPHQHDTALAIGEANRAAFGLSTTKPAVFGTQIAPLTTALTSSVGDGSPIQTLPPFVVLLYCEKK
jgi:hypothetical protein